MLNFLNLKPEAFGLDISDLSVKIIKLKKKRGFFELPSFNERRLKSGIVKDGVIKDEKNLAESIKQTVAETTGKKINTKYVAVSLPEEKAFLRLIQLPLMPKEDLKSAIIYESENHIPLPIDQVYLGYQTVPFKNDRPDHLDVLIGAVPKDVVDSYLSCLKSAGLKPISLEVESLAVARAVIKGGYSAEAVLLIDLGATRTGFIVYSGHSVRFTSSIPVSGINFTRIIAKNLKIEETEAEKLKIKYGLEKKERGKIFEALVPAIVDLVQQIKKYLEYYQTHPAHYRSGLEGDKNEKITKIFLCGGGANLAGLPELLSLELKIPVEIADPWVNVGEDDKKNKLPFARSLGYTTALGLAISAANDSFEF